MDDPIVRVEGVHKRFGEVHALRGVDLEIARGGIYGLLGPNGAGKTTLINVLSTLLAPDEGTATVAGLDVVEDAEAVRRTIGLAGQFAAVDDYLTGRETVEMVGRLYGLPAAEARRRAEETLGRFDLLDAADRQSKGYSGGMRRRLDLAASLVGEPELLYLDEPTTGIDPASRLDIWDLVRDLVAGGTTVLLTTQYLEEADALADRIGVIADGRLVREGTADELKDSMGTNRIRVRVAPDDVERARGAVGHVGTVEDGGESEPPGVLRTPATEGNRTLLAVLRQLEEHDVEALDLALERPTLDDVFLAVTGRRTPSEQPDEQLDDQPAEEPS